MTRLTGRRRDTTLGSDDHAALDTARRHLRDMDDAIIGQIAIFKICGHLSDALVGPPIPRSPAWSAALCSRI